MAERRQKGSGRLRGEVDALKFVEKLVGAPLTLGALLEAIRKCEDVSQVAMAAKLGVVPQHLCGIERGHKVVSPERAARFAKLLGYSSEQFVRLALQDAVDRAGLRYRVEVTAA